MNNDIYEENLRVLNRIKEYCESRGFSENSCVDKCPFYIWCEFNGIAPCDFQDEVFKKMAEVLE